MTSTAVLASAALLLLAGCGSEPLLSDHHDLVAMVRDGGPVFPPDDDLAWSGDLSPESDLSHRPGLQLSFDIRREGTAGSPQAVAIGDVNRDGRPDAVVATDEGSVGVHLLDNANHLPLAKTIALGMFARGAAVADLDGDFRADIAVCTQSNNSLNVLVGDGAGNFSARKQALSYLPVALAASDLDGDGTVDLVVAGVENQSGILDLLSNGGRADFSSRQKVAAGQTPFAVAIGDLDQDARLDLATVDLVFGRLLAFRNTGGFQFEPPAVVSVGKSPQGVALGLIAGRAHLSAAVPLFDGSMLALVEGDGGGGIAPGPAYPTGGGPSATVLADFDQDDILDVAVANSRSDSVTFLRGSSDGTLQRQADLALNDGGRPSALAVADFNRDGKPDIVVGSPPQWLVIALNTSR